MKSLFAASLMLVISATGCMEPSVEVVEVNDECESRIMMRGDVRHGWTVLKTLDGTQHWAFLSNGTQLAWLTIEPLGYVSYAWYEGANYVMEMKSYQQGQPLGHRTLKWLEQIQHEATRRHIELPMPRHQLPIESLAEVPVDWSTDKQLTSSR